METPELLYGPDREQLSEMHRQIFQDSFKSMMEDTEQSQCPHAIWQEAFNRANIAVQGYAEQFEGKIGQRAYSAEQLGK